MHPYRALSLPLQFPVPRIPRARFDWSLIKSCVLAGALVASFLFMCSVVPDPHEFGEPRSIEQLAQRLHIAHCIFPPPQSAQIPDWVRRRDPVRGHPHHQKSSRCERAYSCFSGIHCCYLHASTTIHSGLLGDFSYEPVIAPDEERTIATCGRCHWTCLLD
jgi:hypothetical protein